MHILQLCTYQWSHNHVISRCALCQNDLLKRSQGGGTCVPGRYNQATEQFFVCSWRGSNLGSLDLESNAPPDEPPPDEPPRHPSGVMVRGAVIVNRVDTDMCASKPDSFLALFSSGQKLCTAWVVSLAPKLSAGLAPLPEWTVQNTALLNSTGILIHI